jgi:signal transduction histidine kinase
VKRKFNWQSRALLIFAILIIALSIGISILAIREAERDLLEKEKELNNEQQRVVSQLVDEVDAYFSEIERFVKNYFNDNDFDLQISDHSAIKRLGAIKNIFLINNLGTSEFLLQKPIFTDLKYKFQTKELISEPENSAIFREAELFEFSKKNYGTAIELYLELYNNLKNNSKRAFILNRIARCHLKKGNKESANRVYRKIIESYSNEISTDGIPFGLIAYFQIKFESSLELFSHHLELYENLLKRKWILNETRFNFYKSKTRQLISDHIDFADTNQTAYMQLIEKWNELLKYESNILNRTGEIRDIKNYIIPKINSRILDNISEQEFYRISERINKQAYYISYSRESERYIVGIHYDMNTIRNRILPSIINTIGRTENWFMKITDDAGSLIISNLHDGIDEEDLQLVTTRKFKQNFPPWNANVWQIYPSSIESQFNKRKIVYILFVLIVMSAIFLGGFFVIRSTAKELRLAKMKSEFVSTVSHEFRTPLTSIRYLSEMLQRNRIQSEEKKKTYYKSITSESERLSRLVENLLDFTKIEANIKQYKFEKTDITRLMNNVVSLFKEHFIDQEFIFNCDISDHLPFIHADKDSISRAVLNLLDNAMKYSKKTPEISLSAKSRGKNILIEVSDNGIGIKAEEQKKVFEKFYRTDNCNIEGSGIGLTLAEHTIKAHGGDIEIESVFGKGTKIIIKLPFINENS